MHIISVCSEHGKTDYQERHNKATALNPRECGECGQRLCLLLLVRWDQLIRKGMDNNLRKIPGASDISELQKIILLGTVHIQCTENY